MVNHCPHCLTLALPATEARTSAPAIVRAGFFIRSSDQQKIQRFRCKTCRKTFSSATLDPCFRQKTRHLNPQILSLLSRGFTLRDIARHLAINKNTVAKRFVFLGIWCMEALRQINQQRPPVWGLQFDDMESFEHTKLKPLSITVAVESKTRWILGVAVSSMPAKGPLAEKSVKKYGPRSDGRKQARQSLFTRIRELVSVGATLESDSNPHYEPDVRQYFPDCRYRTHKGRRGCVVGQGELKATARDELFWINHTCAMKRAKISRLFRRTWNTTKKMVNLELHLNIYAYCHNMRLVGAMR
ncbi:MAG: hypothetical protein N2578_10045 [Bdellovibrionaceae bacterium]|nr:hypothetical protein [Pseudobdellovibrionaceae bacterium]